MAAGLTGGRAPVAGPVPLFLALVAGALALVPAPPARGDGAPPATTLALARAPAARGDGAAPATTLALAPAGSASSDGAAPSGDVPLGTVEVRAEDGQAPAPTAPEDPTAFGTVLLRKDFAGERLETAELLLAAPGTVVRRGPGGETLLVRGASPDQTLIFLDGIRLNPASGGGIDLRSIPAGLIEKITLLRGNEGARYGAGALGGVALITTRPPRPGDLEATAELSAGSFGTAGLDAAVAGGRPTLHGLAGLSLARTSGDYSALHDPTPGFDPGDARTEVMQNNDGRRGALLLKGAAELGPVRLDSVLQGAAAERGLPGTLFDPSPDSRREDERLLAAVRARADPSESVELSASLQLRHDRLVIEQREQRLSSPPATTATGRPWQKETAVAALAGVEATPADFALLRLEGSAGQEALSGPYHGDHGRPLLWASLSPELFAGDHVTVAPVLRYDRVGEHDGLSPKLGVAVRPLPALELRANGGRTFRAPSMGELFLEQGAVRPNPDLTPEHGYAVDGGVLLRLPRLLASASLFWARTDELISYEIVAGGIARPFNFHDAETKGGELELSVRPLRVLTLSSSYTRAETANLRDDPRFWLKELPYRPRHRLQGRVAAKGAGLSAFFEASHQAEQFTNRSNTDTLPAQTSVRTGAGARVLTAPYEIWASGQLDNLLDAMLLDQLGFPQPGRAIYVVLRAGPSEEEGSAGGAFEGETP